MSPNLFSLLYFFLSNSIYLSLLFRKIGNRTFFTLFFLDLVKRATFVIMCTDKYKEWYPHSHGNFMLCVHAYNAFRLGFF